jgi:hypothetical protein
MEVRAHEADSPAPACGEWGYNHHVIAERVRGSHKRI